MAAASVTAGIAVSREDFKLDHAVPLEMERPDMQAQFDWEAREQRPGGETRDWGHGLAVTEMHIVKEHGCRAILHLLAEIWAGLPITKTILEVWQSKEQQNLMRSQRFKRRDE